MKKLIKILFFLLILVFSAATCYAQEVTVPADTTKSVRNKTESKENNQDQNQNQNQSASQDNSKGKSAGGAKSVKSVNSARPDWSKAKGARPNIVRPSGSGVPKGAGKPGGAGRIKGR
jgi:hypothetical protein